jgi:hypothetical protein
MALTPRGASHHVPANDASALILVQVVFGTEYAPEDPGSHECALTNPLLFTFSSRAFLRWALSLAVDRAATRHPRRMTRAAPTLPPMSAARVTPRLWRVAMLPAIPIKSAFTPHADALPRAHRARRRRASLRPRGQALTTVLREASKRPRAARSTCPFRARAAVFATASARRKSQKTNIFARWKPRTVRRRIDPTTTRAWPSSSRSPPRWLCHCGRCRAARGAPGDLSRP